MGFENTFSDDTAVSIGILCGVALAAILLLFALVLFLRSRGACCFADSRDSAGPRRAGGVDGAPRSAVAFQYQQMGGGGAGPRRGTFNRSMAVLGSGGAGSGGGGGGGGAGSGGGAADLEDYLTNLVGTMDDRFQQRQHQQRPGQCRHLRDRDGAMVINYAEGDEEAAGSFVGAAAAASAGGAGVTAGATRSDGPRRESPAPAAAAGEMAVARGGDAPPEDEQLRAAQRGVRQWLQAVHAATAHLQLCDLEPPVFEFSCVSHDSFQGAQSLASTASRYSTGSSAAGGAATAALSSASPRYAPSQLSAAATPRVSELGGFSLPNDS